MNGFQRELRRSIESVAHPLGIEVDGPEPRSCGHWRWTLRWGKRSRFFATSKSPRCKATMIRKARSKARRACEELLHP